MHGSIWKYAPFSPTAAAAVFYEGIMYEVKICIMVQIYANGFNERLYSEFIPHMLFLWIHYYSSKGEKKEMCVVGWASKSPTFVAALRRDSCCYYYDCCSTCSGHWPLLWSWSDVKSRVILITSWQEDMRLLDFRMTTPLEDTKNRK